jgi:hypothetical protein
MYADLDTVAYRLETIVYILSIEICRSGYSSIQVGSNCIRIMEETTNEEYKDITLDDKLRRVIEEHNPDLYIAIFSKDARMDGVAFELGCYVVNIIL